MDYCVLLTSNLDTRYLNNVNMLKAYFKHRNIPYDEIEATELKNRSLRDSLMQIAVDNGGQAEYPALFIMRSNRNIQFVGNWAKIQSILDNDGIPAEDLKMIPEMYTFRRYFRDIMYFVYSRKQITIL